MSPTGQYLVLANAGAGSTERDAVGAAVARLAEHAPVEMRWTADPDDFGRSVAGASEETQIVIAGGDGSIHLALVTIDRLGRNGIPIGIVPLGTGNDFARNHGIPLDPRKAAEVVVAGAHRPADAIDLVDTDTKTLVANNLHFGLGVDAARRAQSLKSAAGRFAYPIATAYEGLSGSPGHFEVHGDGDLVWSGPALAVLVLLGPSMGGGVEVVPDRTDAIDLVVIGPADVRDRLALVRDVWRGAIEDHPAVHRQSVSSVVVSRPGGDQLAADVAGELMTLGSTVDLRLRREAWRVLLPSA